jgi:single-strand DNA-binding protein
MRSVNKVILVGNLGRDAETKPVGNSSVTKFSVACERSWKDKSSGQWMKETDWIDVVAWEKERLAEYLLKGARVYVEGAIRPRTYQKDGNTVKVWEVRAEEIILVGDSNSGGAQRKSRDDFDDNPWD